jgi:hypothetical protein
LPPLLQTSLVNGVPGSGAGCDVGVDRAAKVANAQQPHTPNNTTAGTMAAAAAVQANLEWRAFSSVAGACAHDPAAALATAFRKLEGPAVNRTRS